MFFDGVDHTLVKYRILFYKHINLIFDIRSINYDTL